MENKNLNLRLKSKTVLIPLFLIVWYWIYLNFVFGYWLSEIFYNFFYSTKLKKKFTFKNIIQVIIDFFWNLIKNWFIRIGKKSLLLKDAIDRLIIAVKIFRKKFKSLLKVKHTFQLLKNLLPIPSAYVTKLSNQERQERISRLE